MADVADKRSPDRKIVRAAHRTAATFSLRKNRNGGSLPLNFGEGFRVDRGG
ncbi:MAG: hypothetical protein ABSC25_10490 [Roseiarcus sp.]